MAKRPGANLTLIGAAPADKAVPPPAHLDECGAALWREVCAVFEWDDPGSYEVLSQLCAARSRAERCRQIIDTDGEMIRTKTGMRSHPLLRDELQNRAFVCRSLARLGLDLQPLRSGPGRPPGMA